MSGRPKRLGSSTHARRKSARTPAIAAVTPINKRQAISTAARPSRAPRLTPSPPSLDALASSLGVPRAIFPTDPPAALLPVQSGELERFNGLPDNHIMFQKFRVSRMKEVMRNAFVKGTTKGKKDFSFGVFLSSLFFGCFFLLVLF